MSKSDTTKEQAINQMLLTLDAAARQFRGYENQHLLKGTNEGRMKAATNSNWAENCESAAAEYRKPSNV